MIHAKVPERNGVEYRGFYKATVDKITPGGDTCFARLMVPKDGVEYAVLNIEETHGAQHLRNKNGGSFAKGELITILKMERLGDSFTALELA